MTPPLPDLVLYGRPGCHLCEDTRALLDALLADRTARGLPAPGLVERSIEDDADALARYALTIPVVAYGSQVLELATGVTALRRFLGDALDNGARP